MAVVAEANGRTGIAKMRKSFSADDCVALIPKLKDLIDRPLPLDECWARDHAWVDHAYGWQGRFLVFIDQFFDQNGGARKATRYLADRELAQSRLLLCELAIRAYSLERGRNPAALADLVPRYLPEVPKDPFNGGDFVYRVTPSGYELHSVEIESASGRPFSADNP